MKLNLPVTTFPAMSVISRVLVAAVLATAAGAMPLQVRAAAQATPLVIADDHVILLEAGVHKLLREAQPVARVAVGDPDLAEVTVINRREVLITAKKNGITSLLVWPKTGPKAVPVEYRLRIGPANDPLRPKITDPDLAKARIDPQNGLAGTLPNLMAYRNAKIEAQSQAQQLQQVQSAGSAPGGSGAPAKVTDRSVVDLETQVMTEVKIVELKRSTLKEYGLNIFKNTLNTSAALTTPGSVSSFTFNLPDKPGLELAQSQTMPGAFNLFIGNPLDGILGVLSFLESRGLARTYAEPTLTAMSGQTASFLAGGEFPVPVLQGGGSGSSSGITVQFREFGIRLSLTPTVLSRERIALKVAPEVSDLDFTAGITSGGVTVPALTIRRTDTTVELGDGESFVISGLVSNSLVNNANKVPWLGDVPVLGAFFKSVSVSRNEKELVMVVTPHLVRPLSRTGPRPPLPGASTDNYRPGFGQIMFEETGQFGFSK